MAAGAAIVLATACGGRLLPQNATGGAGGPGGGAAGGAGGPGGGTAGGAGNAAGSGGGCTSYVVQCNDGIDNDGDGKIDSDDPECLGALDNDESSFAYGIPGDNIDSCTLDCFFDGNSGSGDDTCNWKIRCEPANTWPSCPYDAAYAGAHPDSCSLQTSQPQTCVDRCGKLTPNGCDCFGCCLVPGMTTPVRLASSCTAADFGDPTKCPPCTQVTQCLNPCERCEVCIGKPALPDGCQAAGGGPPYTCPGGALACGRYGVPPSQCPCGTSCVTGCCLPLYPLP